MIKKEYRLISVAIIIGVLGIAALMYFNSKDPDFPVTEDGGPSSSERVTQGPEKTSPEEPSDTSERPADDVLVNPGVREPTPAELALNSDPVIESQKKLVSDFKNLTRMDIKFPPDFEFKRLDVEGKVAAMEGVTAKGDRKMVVLAAPLNPSPEAIVSYLADQKGNIPSLADHNFKISGKIRNLEVPPGKGLSKITLIPGGEKNGVKVVAALLQRADGKGSYVFIMRAKQSYYDNYEGEAESMLDSFSAK